MTAVRTGGAGVGGISLLLVERGEGLAGMAAAPQTLKIANDQ